MGQILTCNDIDKGGNWPFKENGFHLSQEGVEAISLYLDKVTALVEANSYIGGAVDTLHQFADAPSEIDGEGKPGSSQSSNHSR